MTTMSLPPLCDDDDDDGRPSSPAADLLPPPPASSTAFAAAFGAGSASGVRQFVAVVRALQISPVIAVAASGLGIRLIACGRAQCSAYIPALLFSSYSPPVGGASSQPFSDAPQYRHGCASDDFSRLPTAANLAVVVVDAPMLLAALAPMAGQHVAAAAAAAFTSDPAAATAATAATASCAADFKNGAALESAGQQTTLSLVCSGCPAGPLELHMRDGDNVETRCFLNGFADCLMPTSSTLIMPSGFGEQTAMRMPNAQRILLRADFLHEALLELAEMDTVTISRRADGLVFAAAAGERGTAEIMCPCEFGSTPLVARDSNEEGGGPGSSSFGLAAATYSCAALAQCLPALALACRVALQIAATENSGHAGAIGNGAMHMSCMLRGSSSDDTKLFIDFVIPALVQF